AVGRDVPARAPACRASPKLRPGPSPQPDHWPGKIGLVPCLARRLGRA
ncbi:hypothetical protein KSS87_013816, partial [Heliosperma pusillum]